MKKITIIKIVLTIGAIVLTASTSLPEVPPIKELVS